MTKENFKKEINKRLKDDLWDVKIARGVINKQKAIKNRNIKAISSLAAACLIVTGVYVSLFFEIESNQNFMAKYNDDQIITDDIISFAYDFDKFDENEFIILSKDIDAIIELEMNARL